MTKLNLIPDNPAENKVKKYLEENASETLAEKINNGVKITKNNLTLINKKSLKDFMKYASEEARKTVKNSSYACIEDETVYGWAIHYFEEDSIEGKLYKEDGTEYVEEKKKKTTKPVVKNNSTTTTASETKTEYIQPEPKKENKQFSIFDMLTQPEEPEQTETKTEEIIKEEKENIEIQIQPEPKKENTISEIYTKYMDIQNKYPDCIIFYRMGDFYEILDKNAEITANELELTLTGRDFGLEKRTPMVGIPYHAADSYISKLVTKGYKVAIAEDNALIREIKTEIKEQKEKTINEETGEITNVEENEDDFDPTAFDPEALTILIEKLDGKIIVE